MNNYFKNQKIRRLVYKTYFSNKDFSYLVKKYFYIYQTFLNNDIILYDNSFLRMFLQYYKNKNTYLYYHLESLNFNSDKLMIDFIKDIIEIKKLDILMDNQNNLDKIEMIYKDIFYNLGNDYYVQPEEKEIHEKIYRDLLKDSKLDKDELILIIKNTFDKTIEYINNFEIPSLYNKLTINKASDKCYTDELSMKMYKQNILERINDTKEMIISSFDNEDAYTQILNKHFLNFLLNEDFEVFENSKISTFLYASSCTAYSFDLLFKCFCNKSNRKKLKTIQNKNNSYNFEIQTLIDVFNNTRQDLSYFAEIIMCSMLGLEENEIYRFTNRITNKDIKRIEFDKNFKKFSDIFSLRSKIDEHFTNFKLENIEKIKEKNKDFAKNIKISQNKESSHDFFIFEDFEFFLTSYLIENKKENYKNIFHSQFESNTVNKNFNIFINISVENYENILIMNYKNYYSEFLPKLIDSFIKNKTF